MLARVYVCVCGRFCREILVSVLFVTCLCIPLSVLETGRTRIAFSADVKFVWRCLNVSTVHVPLSLLLIFRFCLR